MRTRGDSRKYFLHSCPRTHDRGKTGPTPLAKLRSAQELVPSPRQFGNQQQPRSPKSPPPPQAGAAPRAQCGATLGSTPSDGNARPHQPPRPLPPVAPRRLALGVSRQLCRHPPPTVPASAPTTIYFKSLGRGRAWPAPGTRPPPLHLGRRRRSAAPPLGALPRLARTSRATRAQCYPRLPVLGTF